MTNPIITRLDEAAAKAGMTRGEVGRAANVGSSTLSRLERLPESGLQAQTVLKLAKVLNVNAKWLATGEEPQEPAVKNVKNVKAVKKVKKLRTIRSTPVVVPVIPELEAGLSARAAPQANGFLPQLIASKVALLPDDGQRIVLGFVIETLERINASR